LRVGMTIEIPGAEAMAGSMPKRYRDQSAGFGNRDRVFAREDF